jgi:hypothetical protein
VPSFFFLIPGDLSAWFGGLSFVLLMFIPGAWIAFVPALEGVPFWARLFTGAMLSPLVLCAEFYAVRLMGFAFGPTAVILVFLNLPVLYFVWKRRGDLASLTTSGWLAGVAAVAIPAACLTSILIHMDTRIFAPHSWLHADPMYMFARGDLVPEAPTLAGIRLSYPVWTALVGPVVQSFLLNSPPVSTYVWGNLVALIAVYAFAAAIAKELGGGKLAQFTCGIWLFLGANPIGYILMRVAPRGGSAHYLWGDPRYTPWVSKFQSLTPMVLALGMLMAMIYFLIRADKLTRSVFVVIGLLLLGIGLLYPLLFPPACGIVAARALAPLAQRKERERPYREWLAWAGLLLVAVLLTYSEIKFLTSGRQAAAGPVLLSPLTSAARKIIGSLIATSLLLGGLAFTIRECWKARPAVTVTLLGGALSGYILYAFFFIPFYENEYKFVFPVAMCLSPFAALAVEKIWRQWPRKYAVAFSAALILLVAGPFAQREYMNWPAPPTMPGVRFAEKPSLDLSAFQLRLTQPQAWAGICDAVLRRTPPNSILLVDNVSVYYPAVTSRSLYVASANEVYPGLNLYLDDIDANVRGYGQQIIEQRRATLTDVFGAADATRREQAIDVILALKRPIAIVAEARHAGLVEWLERNKTATRLFAQDGLSLWSIDGAGGSAATSSSATATGSLARQAARSSTASEGVF